MNEQLPDGQDLANDLDTLFKKGGKLSFSLEKQDTLLLKGGSMEKPGQSIGDEKDNLSSQQKKLVGDFLLYHFKGMVPVREIQLEVDELIIGFNIWKVKVSDLIPEVTLTNLNEMAKNQLKTFTTIVANLPENHPHRRANEMSYKFWLRVEQITLYASEERD